MTLEEIYALFRQHAAGMEQDPSTKGELISKLAQLLADSRGKLSKENFDMLVHIGGALYKEGQDQYDARKNVSEIMQNSIDSQQK